MDVLDLCTHLGESEAETNASGLLEGSSDLALEQVEATWARVGNGCSSGGGACGSRGGGGGGVGWGGGGGGGDGCAPCLRHAALSWADSVAWDLL